MLIHVRDAAKCKIKHVRQVHAYMEKKHNGKAMEKQKPVKKIMYVRYFVNMMVTGLKVLFSFYNTFTVNNSLLCTTTVIL